MKSLSRLGKLATIARTKGISGVSYALRRRLLSLFAGQGKSFPAAKPLIVGKTGLEIGGPSQAFSARGIFPVYPVVGHLDNCNYAASTTWQHRTEQGSAFHFAPGKAPGRQHVLEATALKDIPSGTYDFLLSSHVLEHIANPILALLEWKRVLKEGGTLVLIVPDRKGTFDHLRPVTSMDHLIHDFETGVNEHDLTHKHEILALHDLQRDPDIDNLESFRARADNNFENRCFHHHVFDAGLASCLVTHIGFKILAVETLRPYHILVLAQKMENNRPC